MNFGDILDQWETDQKEHVKKEAEKQKELSKRPAGSGKKLNAPSAIGENKEQTVEQKKSTVTKPPKRQQPQINPMDLWLRRYGVIDKDKAEEYQKQKEAFEDISVLRNMASEATLDLHGLTRDEAWDRLDAFITECRKRNLRKVLIIHGKGNHSDSTPILSGVVRTFIEHDYRLGQSGHPDKSEGGKGATWVIVRPASTTN